jgi:hypothetical protein
MLLDMRIGDIIGDAEFVTVAELRAWSLKHPVNGEPFPVLIGMGDRQTTLHPTSTSPLPQGSCS